MGLTYKKVMSTQYDKLTAAAKAWDDMASDFKKAESAYAAATQGLAQGNTTWQGIAQGAAYTNFAGTQYEYGAAQTQAKAVANLLRDAHGQFTELKQRLESVVADARKAKMAVDDEGNVRPDLTAQERYAYVHDPDGQKLLGEWNKAANDWADQIKKYVKAFEDADAGVKLALAGAVKDSNKDAITGKDATRNGFNADAKSDIEEYELEYVKDVATRLNSGAPVPNADVEAFNRIMRDNSNPAFKHHTEFGRDFVGVLGAEGTIKLANTLNNVAHSGDSGRKGLYGDTNKSLANTLANATQMVFVEGQKNPAYGTKEYQQAFEKWSKTPDAKFYNDFMADLKKAGLDRFDLDVAADKAPMTRGQGQEIRGYQGLVTLMQQGDGYSPQFLGDLTDQMIDAEKKDKDVWDLHGKFEGSKDGWFKNDPVDATLGIMSRNPEAATGYLDPANDGDKNRLEYLTTKRDWDVVNTVDWRGNMEISGSDTFDKDARTGLGLAIEAATTGRAAGSPGAELGRHSEAQARIMHDTINLLDYGSATGRDGDDSKANGDNLLKEPGYASMRGSLARALASYTPDMVDTIVGDGTMSGQPGSGSDGNESRIQNSRSSMLRIMRGVSEDPENFFLLHEAERRYTAHQLTTQDLSDPEAVKNLAAKIGEANGAYNAVGGDVHLGERDSKLSAAGDQRVYGYHVIGGAITGIPVVGDMAQRVVDGYWNEWLKGVTAEQGLLARDRISSGNDAAQDDLNRIFDSWGTQTRQSETMIDAAQREARQSYTSGRESAYDALRERK
ncbi:PPE family protein [Streptomyces sp. PCS3-D2]|uniref:PPE family protein n=1 Tax=Streptomyces sp. PCS3-D2 TaxID=1460244 RepID=UPI000B0999D0|nr:PPE family protein [Streptomyces sp. PCS3-D2]WKV72932.1 PPE family protein [Streptomyces sp. PCS3-D2]